jgi:N-acetylneuraminic acid mutarotase
MKNFYSTLVLFSLVLCVSAQTQYGWIQKASIPALGRHRSTAIACGNRGYIGLGHINSVAPDVLFSDWWEYDPGTDTWSQKANFGGGLRYHAAGFAIGNNMYVGTGRAPSGVLMNDFWKYSPATNTWTAVTNFPGAVRRGAVGFEINGYGYVGTGSYYADFYRYDPVMNSWTTVAPLSIGRISAVGLSLNGKGYCGTGDIGGNSGDWYEYNPTLNTWITKASLPGLPRMEACGFTMQGRCYLGTGDNYSSGVNYQDFWCYNPATNSWIQVADFAGAARRYLVALSLNGKAYAGSGTSGMNYNDWWEFGTISGVEESEFPVANVYPVPSSGPVTFSFNKTLDNNVTCVLYDISGKEVRVESFSSGNQFTIERQDLSVGTYMYSLTSNSDFIGSGKIIFQ